MLRFVSLAVLAASLALPLAAAEFRGTMAFSDADTLRVGDRKVRLHGIDAPEGDQTCSRPDGRAWACGEWATREAQRLFDGRPAVCADLGTDQYGRTLATCTLRGVDIAEVMVSRGMAVAYTRYSRDYVTAERTATRARAGIWNGSFTAPEDWRSTRSAPAAVQAVPGRCAIKGNISSNGHIYHLPGQEHYDRTVIDPSDGERWFCTESEARAAGWRRARR